MSILTEQRSDPVDPAKRIATQIVNSTARTTKRLLRDWEQSFDALYNNDRATTEEILAEMGTDAGDVFALSTAMVVMMSQVLPGLDPDEWDRLQAKIAEKPATTTNVDGTVTVD